MRRPFITVVGIAAIVVALLFIATVVAVRTADIETLTAPLAARIKAQTGRDLTIKGGISISPSLEPRIAVREIALANPEWASDPQLVSAKRMDVELALLPLLSRKLDVRRIVLKEPVIALETDASGRGNWENARTAPASPAAGTPVDASALPAALAVGVLEIDNGVLTYRNGQTGAVTHVDIEHLEVHARDPAAPVNAAFRGNIDGVAVALTGNAGPLAALLDRRVAYPVTAQGEVAGRPTVLKARLVTADAGTQVRDIDVVIGNSRATGSVVASGTGAARNVAITLASPRWSLRDLATLPAATKAGAAAPAIAASAGTHLIPDAPLPIRALRDTNVSLDAAIDELVLKDGQSARAVQLKATSTKGMLRITQLHAAMFGGALDVTGAVDATATPPVVELRIAGRDLDAGQLLAAAGGAREIRGARAAVHLQARGRGTSLHEWASTATGEASIVLGPGTIPFVASDKTSAYAQVMSAVSPLARGGEAIALHCAVLRMPVNDGVSSIYRTFAVETDHLALEGTGRIDLGQESLDLRLRPTVRQGAGLIAAEVPGAIRVHGGWKSPQIEIDRASTAAAVAKLGAIAASGGLSALGGALVISGVNVDGPCAIALGTAGKAPPQPAEQALPIKDIARSLGRLLSR